MMDTSKLPHAKGASRQQVKAREHRRARVIITDVRKQCVDRDGYCRLWYFNDALRAEISGMFGACRGRSEWSHFGNHKRFKTRSHAPDDRHTTDGSLMLCQFHHHEYDQNRMRITALSQSADAAIGTNGRLRFERDGKIWEEQE